MSRSKDRSEGKVPAGVSGEDGTPLVFAGVVETADPETGRPESLKFWLPAGISARDLGLTRVLLEDAA